METNREMRAAVATVAETTAEGEFSAFYEENFAAVARLVSWVTRSPNDAFDVVQEAFARTWANWSRVGRSEQPVFYTFRIARNLCNRQISSSIRRAKKERFAETTHAEGDASPSVEMQLVVQDALRRLPPRQRWAVVLCDMFEFSAEEAASVLRIAPSTVRVHSARGRERLRRLLSRSLTDSDSTVAT